MKNQSSKTASKKHTPVQKSSTSNKLGKHHPISTHWMEGSDTSINTIVEKQESVELCAMAIDKMVLALYDGDCSESYTERIQSQLSYIFRNKSEQLNFVRGTTKGEAFRKVYVHKLSSGSTVKYGCDPSRKNIHQQLQITLNPNQLSSSDIPDFEEGLRRVIGLRADELIPKLRVTRIDLCVDVRGVHVQDLIVMLKDARVASTFFVHSDTGGQVQTIYLGSIESPVHGCVYDVRASDEYKAAVNEKPSAHYSRVSARENAQITVQNFNQKSVTRMEIRNTPDRAVLLRKIKQLATPFETFEIYSVPPDVVKDGEFACFLDCVRLRGLSGAKAFLKERLTKKALDRHVDRLNRSLAPWWSAARTGETLIRVLRRNPDLCRALMLPTKAKATK